MREESGNPFPYAAIKEGAAASLQAASSVRYSPDVDHRPVLHALAGNQPAISGTLLRGEVLVDRFAEMEALIRVVDAGSFSSAAKQLHIGQPAVSKTIAQLEDRLGVRQ